ncbi:MAG: metal-dependent hydrolase [Campylobacterales bacterium]|nr:metal-dependent hydrolase [Campylobacterales bacterium]
MSRLIHTMPKIAWQKGFARHWNGGNLVWTHIINALSFAFPQGERFFVKTVKEVYGQKELKIPNSLKVEIELFIRQELAHTKEHQEYNRILESQGYKNVAYTFLEKIEAFTHQYFSPLTKLGIVSAYEHHTATLGSCLLSHPQILQQAPKEIALFWEWHAMEEIEHKAVCFDLYQAAGGGWLRRIFTFLFASLNLNILFVYLYFNMLRQDGALRLFKLPRTLWQTALFFWGKGGIGWYSLYYGIQYILPNFHPWKKDDYYLIESWLKKHKNHLR